MSTTNIDGHTSDPIHEGLRRFGVFVRPLSAEPTKWVWDTPMGGSKVALNSEADAVEAALNSFTVAARKQMTMAEKVEAAILAIFSVLSVAALWQAAVAYFAYFAQG